MAARGRRSICQGNAPRAAASNESAARAFVTDLKPGAAATAMHALANLADAAHMQAVPPPATFAVDGNRLTLLTEGPGRMEALLRLIGTARRSLRVLYYIYVADEVREALRDALLAAAWRGVEVHLIVDGQGFFDPLREAGVDVCRFVPRWGRRYLLRNHQKLALADEERVMIGGFNIEDSYFGTAAEAAWRDLGLMVEGPAAARLTGYFDALSRWAKRPKAGLRSLAKTLRPAGCSAARCGGSRPGPVSSSATWSAAR